MKKLLLFFIFLINFVVIGNVMAANNPYPHYEESVFGGQIVNCTWYAWQAAKDRMGVELPTWYYVQTWYSKASKAGYSVGKEPRQNSLMVWNYGEGFGGHVAYVTKVEGDLVTYDEGGSPMTESGINTDSLRMSDMQSFLVGFIYLDVPRTTTTKKVVTTKSTTKKPPTTITTMSTTIESTTMNTETTTRNSESTTSSTTIKSNQKINETQNKKSKINYSKFVSLFIAFISICLIAFVIFIFKRK